jgi:diamine N-acetyltransferase
MIKIKEAKITDAKQIAEIGRKTFIETYKKENAPGDMEKYLSNAFSESKIEIELAEPNSIFLLANEDEKIIGYAKIKLNNGVSDLDSRDAMEIERLYVLGEYFGKKVGKRLIEECIRIGKNKNCKTVWVQVWGDKYDTGLRAIEFYKKWGFKRFGKKTFNLGDSKQEDLLMKKEI